MNSKFVVYTCMFGHSERFNDFEYAADGVDFVCFTDDPNLTSSFWKMRLVERGVLDPARRSKQFKSSPHRFFPEYDFSLYLDNTVQLKTVPRQIFETYLLPADSSLVGFRHPWRDCAYDEAEAVIDYGFDDPLVVRRQMELYRRLGYPAHHGLTKATFMLRRHHDPAVVRVMERWREQVLHYSLRDQLSLDLVMWSEKFKIAYMPHRWLDYELLQWPMIDGGVRLPRDFDEERYRALNPDVASDPRRHYLECGAAEGRRYK